MSLRLGNVAHEWFLGSVDPVTAVAAVVELGISGGVDLGTGGSEIDPHR